MTRIDITAVATRNYYEREQLLSYKHGGRPEEPRISVLGKLQVRREKHGLVGQLSVTVVQSIFIEACTAYLSHSKRSASVRGFKCIRGDEIEPLAANWIIPLRVTLLRSASP